MTYLAKSDKALQRAINRFADASEEMAFKGSNHPDDWVAIEIRYATTKKLLESTIERRVNAT